MSVYDFDGFDDYTTAQLLKEHLRIHGAPAIVSGGRNGGNRLRGRAYSASNSSYVCRPLLSQRKSFVFGGYWQIDDMSAAWYPFDIRDQWSSQIGMVIYVDGSLAILRSSTGAGTNGTDFGFSSGTYIATNLGTSAVGVVPSGVPFHMQVGVTIGDADGAVEVKINGVTVLNLTGVDTQVSANAYATNLLLCGYANTGDRYIYLDDYWLADAFLGDCRVDTHVPTEDGTHQDGTPLGGALHHDEVDEAAADDDTSYITLSAANQRESFGVEAFKNDGANILGVMLVVDAKKANEGAGMIAPSIVSTGDHDGNNFAFTTAYERGKQIWETDPGDSGAWTAPKFDAAEFGVVKSV